MAKLPQPAYDPLVNKDGEPMLMNSFQKMQYNRFDTDSSSSFNERELQDISVDIQEELTAYKSMAEGNADR